MPITVKHSKVSTIPDDADTSLVRPSDWNADHTLVGLGTMAEQNANAVAITGGTMSGVVITGYIPTTQKGVANGVATLDAGGKVPVSELPAAVLGALSYQGTWDASTNTPTLTSSVGTKGYYYVVNVAGNTDLNGITDWLVGDWAVYNGSIWQKVDNTDAGGDVVGPASATDNAIARFDTTTGKLLQNSVTLIDDTGNASGILSQQFSDGTAVTLAAGKIWYNGTTGSWNAGMGGGNITQQIGEELFVYGKASAAITDSPLQIIYQTGTVGASGVITFAPTIASITDGTLILGVATESLALNDFGRITSYGVVRGITTNGTAFGETWADGDEIYYNPVTGNPTNIKPVAPNVKVSVGTLIKAGSGGSGSIQVEINHGSVLGGTDANVQLTSVSNGQIISYDGGNGYWKNTDLTAGTAISVTETANGVLTVNNTGVTSAVAGTGISVSGATGAVTVTNTAPDQIVSLTGAGTTSISGTYPNFTVTSNDQFTGTVTSVTGTAPVVSSGGNTPAISMAAANTTTDGYLTSTDWNTFNGKGAGTVTSVDLTAPSIFTVSGSPVTTSGTLALTYSGTALPIANGGTGATTAAEAFSDLTPLTLTTASATPLVLTNTSGYQQQITGSTNQTITLPSTATLAVGWSFLITNGTGFTVTVQTSTGASVYSNSNIGSYRVWCVSTANNNAASWSAGAETFSFETGTGSVVRATSPTIASATLTAPTATGALAFTGTTTQAAQFATNVTTGNGTMFTSLTSGTLSIGGATGTGIQIFGRSTLSQTTNIQAGATSTGNTKAINIGTGGLAGSTTNIAVGSTTGTSTTTLNGALSLQNALPVAQGGTGLTTVPHTVQVFTSSSGTYTTPANVKAIWVRCVGGGGGGGATAGAGGAGGATTFGSSLLTANGGGGGSVATGGIASGGTASGGDINISGGEGGAGPQPVPASYAAGAAGGNSAFGGGAGQSQAATAGTNGATNSGGGGSGGSGGPAPSNGSAGGGGAGGYCEKLINAPSSTYSYAVGAGGAAGSGGTAGGAGGSGVIIVTEYYV